MNDLSSTSPEDARIVVFVSDALRRTIQRPHFDCRPPAGRGDVSRLLCERASSQYDGPLKVGIIDGTNCGPSLPPKEVMQAMGAGVHMYGAAGDGALRAAECGPYGMTGVGRIFDHATSQLVSPVDEYWTPNDAGPHDQSMAAWRIALTDAVADATVDVHDARFFLTAAKQVPWRQRTLASVQMVVEQVHARKLRRVQAILSEEHRHVVRQDALAMIRVMQTGDVDPGSEAAFNRRRDT